MEQPNKDIKEIKEGMLEHNKSDILEFSAIKEKIDRNHDTQIRLEEILKDVLVQAKKTNGRCTSLEEAFARLDKNNDKLTQIVSFHHNQYENFVTQQEKLGLNFVTQVEFDPFKKIVQGGVALVLTVVVTALLGLIIVHKI